MRALQSRQRRGSAIRSVAVLYLKGGQPAVERHCTHFDSHGVSASVPVPACPCLHPHLPLCRSLCACHASEPPQLLAHRCHGTQRRWVAKRIQPPPPPVADRMSDRSLTWARRPGGVARKQPGAQPPKRAHRQRLWRLGPGGHDGARPTMAMIGRVLGSAVACTGSGWWLCSLARAPHKVARPEPKSGAELVRNLGGAWARKARFGTTPRASGSYLGEEKEFDGPRPVWPSAARPTRNQADTGVLC